MYSLLSEVENIHKSNRWHQKHYRQLCSKSTHHPHTTHTARRDTPRSITAVQLCTAAATVVYNLCFSTLPHQAQVSTESFGFAEKLLLMLPIQHKGAPPHHNAVVASSVDPPAPIFHASCIYIYEVRIYVYFWYSRYVHDSTSSMVV